MASAGKLQRFPNRSRGVAILLRALRRQDANRAFQLQQGNEADNQVGGYMRRLLRGVVARVKLLGSTSLLLALVTLALTSAATAETDVQTRTPFTFAGDNPCTGEALEGTGNLHLVMSSNLSMSGMVQFHLEANLEGMHAATIAGKKYQVPFVSPNWSFGFDSDGAPAHETFESLVQFVRLGEDGSFLSGDDFYEHFLTHITANANGTVTVSNITYEARCK
jgi:hypothetical protein